MTKISVIGAGLAGCETAHQLAKRGFHVDLYEMKPQKFTPAHHYQGFAELVCSNSLKASRLESAAGLLKAEMRLLGSLILQTADRHAVPAGGALAVDRHRFSDDITAWICANQHITVHHQEISDIPDGIVVIAAGPLASEALSASIGDLIGAESLSFYDAAAPIVAGHSIDKTIAFEASRYGRGQGDDYLNCPMNQQEYQQFYEALAGAQTQPLEHIEDTQKRVYEGCMPVEVMAKRGMDTLRFGPMKPVGLTDPRTAHRPWAVVQLRKENAASSMYNLVGFQTNLKWGEQKRVFSMIPGLENAEFLRFGVMHRNTFLNSPSILNRYFQMKSNQHIFFAGQITGVEGYVESAASGMLAGVNVARMIQGKTMLNLPSDCMMGALARFISDSTVHNFQPMGANMGLLPGLPNRIKEKEMRYRALSERALASLQAYLKSTESA